HVLCPALGGRPQPHRVASDRGARFNRHDARVHTDRAPERAPGLEADADTDALSAGRMSGAGGRVTKPQSCDLTTVVVLALITRPDLGVWSKPGYSRRITGFSTAPIPSISASIVSPGSR